MTDTTTITFANRHLTEDCVDELMEALYEDGVQATYDCNSTETRVHVSNTFLVDAVVVLKDKGLVS